MNQTPMKNDRKTNRVIYVVTVTLLLAISVAVAMSSIASKRKKGNVPDPSLTEMTESEKETKRESEMTAPVTTDRQLETESQTVEPNESTPSGEEKQPSEAADAEPQKFILPVLGILSKKHDTENQVFSATMNDYRTHNGIDIVAKENDPVYASADGVVTQIWDDPLMGKCVALQHSSDVYTVYKNLTDELASGIEEGVSVTSGQLIGAIGNTAMVEIAEEPHLHFEMTVANISVNPLDYFDESSLVSLSIDASFES